MTVLEVLIAFFLPPVSVAMKGWRSPLTLSGSVTSHKNITQS